MMKTELEIWGAINAAEWLISNMYLGICVKTEDPRATAAEYAEYVREITRRDDEVQDLDEVGRQVAQHRNEAFDRIFSYLHQMLERVEYRSGRA